MKRLISQKTKLFSAVTSLLITFLMLPAGQSALGAPASCTGPLSVAFPAAGDHPAASVSQPNCAPDTFLSSTVTWSGGVTSSSYFLAGTVYSATIVLELDPSLGNNCYSTYDIWQTEPVSLQINAVPATESATLSGTTCTLTVTFPATDAFVPAALPLTYPATDLYPSFPSSTAYKMTTHWYDVSSGTELTPQSQFVTGAIYRATIDFGPTTASTPPAKSLLAKYSGYTCINLPSNWFNAPNATSTVSSSTDFTHCHAEVTFAATEYRPITHQNITAAIPFPGNTITTIATDSLGGVATALQYQATAHWIQTDTGQSASGVFAAEIGYSVNVRLTPKADVGFDSTCGNVPANHFYVNGVLGTNAAGSCDVRVDFPIVISSADLPKISIPVTGSAPTTTIATTKYFIGTISWLGDFAAGKFAANNLYTALITLVPKAGYSCNFVPTDFYEIPGAKTSNVAGQCIIQANFSKTLQNIDVSEISGITPPIFGGSAAISAKSTDQFDVSVAWNPTFENGIFDRAGSYVANMTVLPKPGFTCLGVAANFFKVTNAITTTNESGSCDVTATFAPAFVDSKLLSVQASPALGTAISTVDGIAISSSTSRNKTDGSMSINASETNLSLSFKDSTGSNTQISNDGKTVIVFPSSKFLVSGTGYKPSSSVYVFGIGPNCLLGTLTVDANGKLAGNFALPPSFATGTHALQVNGYDLAGKVVSTSYGISFSAKLSTNLIFGAKATSISAQNKDSLSNLLNKFATAKSKSVTVTAYSSTVSASQRMAATIKFLKSKGFTVKKQSKRLTSKLNLMANKLQLKFAWIR